jgi:hypothetical protein
MEVLCSTTLPNDSNNVRIGLYGVFFHEVLMEEWVYMGFFCKKFWWKNGFIWGFFARSFDGRISSYGVFFHEVLMEELVYMGFFCKKFWWKNWFIWDFFARSFDGRIGLYGVFLQEVLMEELVYNWEFFAKSFVCHFYMTILVMWSSLDHFINNSKITTSFSKLYYVILFFITIFFLLTFIIIISHLS